MPRGQRNENKLDWSWIDPRRRASRLSNDETLEVIAGPGCWCGETVGHDWPGKADGDPHPRET